MGRVELEGIWKALRCVSSSCSSEAASVKCHLALHSRVMQGLGAQRSSTGALGEGPQRAGGMCLAWGADVLLHAGQEPRARTTSQGNSCCSQPFSTLWPAETMPGGPSDDKQVKNGGLAMSEPGVSSLF